MSNGKLCFYSTFFVCALVLTSCSRSQTASTEQHPLDMLRIDVGSEAPTLDPALSEDAASGRIINDLFE
ncbi:MAG: hypothetical protein E6Q32_11525 [Neisseriales bacterium]|nr:MAG: hypothetical protein E6Q32_11525 [Neisseriales bacterium]